MSHLAIRNRALTLCLVTASLCLASIVLRPTTLLAGPDGNLDIFPNMINPDASTGAVDFSQCQVSVTVVFGILGRVSFSVYARLAGATTCGISGAECYLGNLEVADLPPGWTKTVVTPPGTTWFGDLVDPHLDGSETIRRANMTWPVAGPGDVDCQREALTFIARVDLMSPFGLPTWTSTSRVRVLAGDPSSDPILPCPVLVLCDAPVFTKVCVSGGELIVNPPYPYHCGGGIGTEVRTPLPGPAQDCPVAVTPSTWSSVKSLYR